MPSKSVCGVWKALRPRPSAKTAKAAGGQEARVDALLQRDGDRRHRKLRDAGHQHDRADLQRVVAAHEGEEDRHQIDRAEEADAEDEAEEAADRETAVGEIAEVDDRVAPRASTRAKKPPALARLRASRPRTRPDSPAALRRLLQRRSPATRAPAPAAPATARSSLRTSPSRSGSRGSSSRRRAPRRHAGHDIDEKQPVPGVGLGDPAADDRADGRAPAPPARRRGWWRGPAGAAGTAGRPRRRRPGSACRRKSPGGPARRSAPRSPALAAQPTEARVKTVIAMTNSQRMPRSRVRRPVSGIAMTSAMR